MAGNTYIVTLTVRPFYSLGHYVSGQMRLLTSYATHLQRPQCGPGRFSVCLK